MTKTKEQLAKGVEGFKRTCGKIISALCLSKTDRGWSSHTEREDASDALVENLTTQNTALIEAWMEDLEEMKDNTMFHDPKHEGHEPRCCDICGWNAAIQTIQDKLKELI